MEKAFKLGKTSATGSFHLFVGVALSSAIMAIGSIILARVLSPVDYGLYSVALVPSLMIELFRDWGVDSAVTKYVAQSRSTENNDNIRGILSASIFFEVSVGLALTLLSICLSGFIAESIFHRPEIASLVAIVSISIFSGSLLKVAQSSFVGFERMKFQSLILICQALIKSVLAPLLVLLGFGALGAVIGYTLSMLLSGVVGLLLLFFAIFRHLKPSNVNRKQIFGTLKQLLHYGVPLSISTIIGGFLVQFYSFMMAFYCSDVMIGNYQVATNFAVLLTFFTVPINTVLFPTFAKLDPQNEPQVLKAVFKSSIKYTAMLLVPATAAVMVLSQPMVSVLFGEQYVYAPFFLVLYVITNFLSAFGSLSLVTFLTGMGETKILMKLSLLPLIFGIPLSFLLIPALGITGVILGTLIASLPKAVFGLFWLWKHYRVMADWWSSVKIFIASGIATAITFLFLTYFSTSVWLELLAGATIFVVTYFSVAPFIGAVVLDDINSLREILSGLGFISKIVNVALSVVAKIAGFSLGRKNKKH